MRIGNQDRLTPSSTENSVSQGNPEVRGRNHGEMVLGIHQ